MRRAIVTVIAPTLIALGALAGACEPDPADIVDEVDNLAPIARVVGAQVARVGEPARFDASASDDEDGVVIVSGDDDGVFEHVFAAPGRFTIRIEAEDDVGAVTAVTLETVVVEGGLEACACDAPCLDAGVCTVDAACVVVATSADEVAPVVDDALTCD
jgi:hypothetical protein